MLRIRGKDFSVVCILYIPVINSFYGTTGLILNIVTLQVKTCWSGDQQELRLGRMKIIYRILYLKN